MIGAIAGALGGGDLLGQVGGMFGIGGGDQISGEQMMEIGAPMMMAAAMPLMNQLIMEATQPPEELES